MRPCKLLASTALAFVTCIALAAPAFAHVSIDPGRAPKGGFVKLAFRVPNEESAANTVSVDVQFPTDHPIASVSVQPKPGWTVQVTKHPLATPLVTDDGEVSEAVSEIVWTGGQIKPGEFDDFSVSAGPLPDDVDSLPFPTVQTYDNGDTVSWIQQTVAGQPEPERPVPVLELSAASQSSGASSNASTAGDTATVVKKETSNGVAIVALVVAALALIAAVAALARGRADRAERT